MFASLNDANKSSLLFIGCTDESIGTSSLPHIRHGTVPWPPSELLLLLLFIFIEPRVEIECEAITTAAASTRQVVVPGVPNLFSAAVVGGQDRVVWVAGQLSFKDGALHGTTIEEQTTALLRVLCVR